ncbi:MAG: DivIVA domain-containing protein [Pseudonocardiaceae bacterium]
MDRSDRRDVTDTAFDVVLRGYDKRQVDERLRFLGSELAAARHELQAACQRVAMLEDALSQARSASCGEPAGDGQFGARVEKILKLAEDEAREVRTAAGAEADELFRVATADAEKVGKVARAEADQLVKQARAEAERLVAAATDIATQRERSSAHELHQLSRLQEEINADLYRVKDVLDSLFGATGAVAGAILHTRRKDVAQPTHQARTV